MPFDLKLIINLPLYYILSFNSFIGGGLEAKKWQKLSLFICILFEVHWEFYIKFHDGMLKVRTFQKEIVLSSRDYLTFFFSTTF